MTGAQRISANAIGALKDALTAAFWFKRDLYDYAKAAVSGEPTFLAGIDWTDQYKRDSVSLFVIVSLEPRTNIKICCSPC